jgi:hypothetical protein
MLANNRNISIQAITVDVITGTYGIQFTDACTNIVIRDCRLLANQTGTSTTSGSPIYKSSQTGVVDSVFIIHNTLVGGYYGILFHGGIAAAYLFGIPLSGPYTYGIVVFDSNTVQDSYYYGVDFYLTTLNSCSANTVLSRTSNSASTWYGIYTNYTNGDIIGNHIIQRNTVIVNTYGIYLTSYNTPLPRGLVANNEIILSTTNAYPGIYVSTAYAEIIHNSIYISGTGVARGIEINGTSNDLVIKNNNIVLASPTAYPIYFESTPALTMFDIDYNNLCAQQYVGYYSSNISTMQAWQQLVTTDIHSIRKTPDFNGLPNHLKFITPLGFFCDAIASVTNDIENTPRPNKTTIGCYEIPPKEVDVSLTDIIGIREGLVLSETDALEVSLSSFGSIPLTSINLEWSINGVSQNAGGTNYPVSLTIEESTTIPLGQITYAFVGNMEIKVWVNSINGNLPDEDNSNDTLSKTIVICSGGYSGTLSVGSTPGNDFQTIEQFENILSLCKANGDIILSLEPGIYANNLNFSNYAAHMSNYTLTITSSTNDADAVTIRPVSGVGVVLSNTENLILKAITIDAATSGTCAIQFTGACTNIVVRDCKLLANQTTTSNASAPVYKANTTGVTKDISFINNTLDGGYYGFYFYGGTGNGAGQFGTNIIFDSNTVSNTYSAGIYTYNTDYTSISCNTITSRTASPTTAQWTGVLINSCNGNVTSNHILSKTTGITQPIGISLQYFNNYNTSDRGLIANNEIILSNMSGNYYGIYANTYTKARILHNSIYISGSGNNNRGIHIANNANNNMVIKNNYIVMTASSAYPIAFSATGNLTLYNIDYNNYFAPNNIGYYSSARTTMSAWQGQVQTTGDLHSVKVAPDFIDPSINSLELDTYDNDLLAPRTEIQTDIKGIIRPVTTSMGAYTQPPVGRDLMLTGISPWNTEAINNQTVQINVDVLNVGAESVTDVTFGWSLNGTTQFVPVTLSPPLNTFEQRNVPVTTFKALNADIFNIVVWVETVNGQQDTAHWNDTTFATATMVPLVEILSPLTDTVYIPDLDIKAKVRTNTGAPDVTPILYLETIVNNSYLLYDTLPMLLDNNGILQASIPSPYYGSKLIYYFTVSDTINNTVTIRDSVYISLLALGKTDSVVIGAGTSAYEHAPISMSNNYGWSRQTYLYGEVCPELFPTGVYITKIAWQSIAARSVYANQACYMRAVDDLTQTTAYLDPLTSGASQVWAGTLNIVPGWIEITLDNPFFLPADKNLEITWTHRNGFSANTTHTWAHTQMPNQMTVAAQNNTAFPATAGTLSFYRPNIKIVEEISFKPYSQNDLGLVSFLSPVNNLDNLCAPDYAPVTAILANLGENDYDFSVDSVSLRLEISAPRETNYSIHIPLHAGSLASGRADTIVFMPALPVMYAGKYDIKAWLESPIDNIIYDDTIFYSYISGRIALPMDDDFSNSVLSSNFIATPIVDTAVWSPYSDPGSPVQPVFGRGMLRYAGKQGSMSQLTIRQLDLDGAVNPQLEFWYYHDSTASVLDKSYTDVNIIADGISTNLLTIFRKDTAHGWKHYIIDLSSDTNAQCILIEFISTNKFGLQSVQYIDRILITSMLDLAVSEIIITPEIAACNLNNKEVRVVIRSVTSQIVDFSNLPTTNLAVEIPGSPTLYHSLQGIVISGYTSNTLLVSSNINIPSGVNTIKAYLTAPIDENPINDTTSMVVDMRPALSVTVKQVTDVNNRINIGVKVWQEAIIRNTGTVDISGIELTLRITGTNQDIIRETLPVDLAVNETYTYRFVNPYIVPADERYQVSLIAYMRCDSANVNTGDAIDEYVDMHNLSVISIDNPSAGQSDTIGATVNITISLVNTDDINSFKNVSIYAVIETEEGEELINRWGSVEEILPLDTQQFTFRESYTVPEDTVYRIRVYLASVDNYPEDDTTEMIRATVEKPIVSVKGREKADVFTLAQNIPNPANTRTRIDYSIPEAGEVIFYVHSVSGQVLYSKNIETSSGEQSIELNTSSFAAGIYFYSLEYKGQRLVKRIMISD